MKRVLELSWDEWYNLLENYFIYYKNSNVPLNFTTLYGYDEASKGYNLWNWVLTQRRNYRDKKLSSEQINKLKRLDFSFTKNNKTPDQIKWEKAYMQLVEYYNYYNNTEVSKIFKTKNGYEFNEQGSCLGLWVRKQRQLYENKKLTEEKTAKLKELNFRFDNNKNQIIKLNELKNNIITNKEIKHLKK